MISTIDENKEEEVLVKQKGHRDKVPVIRPCCVHRYNQYMSGVDRLDQYISYYPFARKGIKWSRKFIVYLFQIAMVNAMIIYNHGRERGPNQPAKLPTKGHQGLGQSRGGRSGGRTDGRRRGRGGRRDGRTRGKRGGRSRGKTGGRREANSSSKEGPRILT